MFTYFTENFFTNQAHIVDESLTRLFSADKISEDAKFDIFLSYNFSDKQIVRGVYQWLKNKGYRVYLDFVVDPQLDRKSVTKETAELIRKRLLNSKSLIYAQSPNAVMSRWMPWELGIVDGNTRRCAILPILATEYTSYSQLEYLRNYPIIRIQTEFGENKIIVQNYGSIFARSFDTFIKETM